jgi:hypothetical protein
MGFLLLADFAAFGRFGGTLQSGGGLGKRRIGARGQLLPAGLLW